MTTLSEIQQIRRMLLSAKEVPADIWIGIYKMYRSSLDLLEGENTPEAEILLSASLQYAMDPSPERALRILDLHEANIREFGRKEKIEKYL